MLHPPTSARTSTAEPVTGKARHAGRHSRRQTAAPLLCPYHNCPRSFRAPSYLKNHLRTHTREKPFGCPREGCNSSFTQFVHAIQLPVTPPAYFSHHQKPLCLSAGKLWILDRKSSQPGQPLAHPLREKKLCLSPRRLSTCVHKVQRPYIPSACCSFRRKTFCLSA